MSTDRITPESAIRAMVGEDTDERTVARIYGHCLKAEKPQPMPSDIMRAVREVEREDAIEAARDRGKDAGKAAGSWAADGNTTQEHARKVLGMLRDGDPEAFDYLPRIPNLSGEMADDPTPTSLAHDVLGTGDLDTITDDDHDQIMLIDEIASAFEDGVRDTYEYACEVELIPAAGLCNDCGRLDAEIESDDDHSEHPLCGECLKARRIGDDLPGEVIDQYISTALWSSTTGDDQGTPLDEEHDAADIAPAAREELEAELADFFNGNAADIKLLAEQTWDYGWESVAHDFWLTRNGHGAGFWDRDTLGRDDIDAAFKRLTADAKVYGSVDLYLGDDGQIYC